MTCENIKPNNNQCRVCQIKDLVSSKGRQIILPSEHKYAVRWKKRLSIAWSSIPDSEIAHCGIGLVIVLSKDS